VIAAVPVGARDGFRHGGKRPVDLALELEAVGQDGYHDRAALVLAGEHRPQHRKPRVGGDPERPNRHGLALRPGRSPWRRHADVSVVGRLLGPLAGTFGQITLGQRLEPPGDALDQEDLVPRGGPQFERVSSI